MIVLFFIGLHHHRPRPRFVSLRFVFGRMRGTWGFKFPRVSFKFVIRHHKIHIGRTLIKLRKSTNKRFRGWFTFHYRRVTYYIRFTAGHIKLVRLHGKKIITSRVTSKPKRRRPHKKRPHKKRPHKKRKNSLLYIIFLSLGLFFRI